MHTELYNLESDPSEARNLAEINPDKRDKLRQMLHSWRENICAKIPKRNPDWKA